MTDDMDEKILTELLEYLDDPDDGGIPLPGSASRRFELQAKMTKILYSSVKEQGVLVRELHDAIMQNPPITMWIRNHLARAFSTGLSGLFLMVGLWFALAAADAQLHISNLDASITLGILGLGIGGLGLLFKAT